VTLPVLYTHVHHGTRRYAPRGGQGNASEIGKGKRAGERDGEAGPARMNEREGGGENFDTEAQRTGWRDRTLFRERERETQTLNFWSLQQQANPSGRGRKHRGERRGTRELII